jgi:hypothetical protein
MKFKAPFSPRQLFATLVAFAGITASVAARAEQPVAPAAIGVRDEPLERKDPTPAVGSPSPATVATAPDAARVLDRVVAIGASATAGFGVVGIDRSRPELGSFPVPLAAAIGGAFDPAASTVDLGSGFFFLDPSGVGDRSVKKAIEADPTCVIAVDFLFWFLYGADDGNGGRLADEAARMDKLELGLALLERIPPGIPLLVGDLPDMREAVGRILSPSQVPTPETLERANARVLAWIAGRPNTFRFGLADTTARLARGDPVLVAGIKIEPRPNGPLLQPDRLHPTFRGTVTLGLQVADTLAAAFGPPVSGRLVRDEVLAAARTRTVAGEREAERRAARKTPRAGPPSSVPPSTGPTGTTTPTRPTVPVSGSSAPAGAR